VVAFTRPQLAARQGWTSHLCGTARFYIAEDGQTVFHGGDYDLSRDEAMSDFADRSDIQVSV
jgi:hypothetical protein